MRYLLISCMLLMVAGCQSWEWQEPIPQYAIEQCLRAHGRPIYDGIGNESHFRCEFQRNLDARYFDDSRLLDPNFNTGDMHDQSKYIIVPVDEYMNNTRGVVITPYEDFNRD